MLTLNNVESVDGEIPVIGFSSLTSEQEVKIRKNLIGINLIATHLTGLANDSFCEDFRIEAIPLGYEISYLYGDRSEDEDEGVRVFIQYDLNHKARAYEYEENGIRLAPPSEITTLADFLDYVSDFVYDEDDE